MMSGVEPHLHVTIPDLTTKEENEETVKLTKAWSKAYTLALLDFKIVAAQVKS
eukprot:CAMPEP_0202346886 /NCGR_PEP_ID=MMETSP1126-20121109/5482_1 /ASSEMBLY_ACC=CAM_ASM_000457 /TAXON_ID=3047 /ORGANISM="Dunaliella tertiolecta, Strain CCMP1320" /LENGTH=52 /DNA_ID=CAMNT_0048938353 /DNA_START=2344 /DNA_END=2502 /DNA_ORIENTATION=-